MLFFFFCIKTPIFSKSMVVSVVFLLDTAFVIFSKLKSISLIFPIQYWRNGCDLFFFFLRIAFSSCAFAETMNDEKLSHSNTKHKLVMYFTYRLIDLKKVWFFRKWKKKILLPLESTVKFFVKNQIILTSIQL